MKLLYIICLWSFIFFNYLYAQIISENFLTPYSNPEFITFFEKKISNFYYNNLHRYSYQNDNLLFKYDFFNNSTYSDYSSFTTKQDLISFSSFTNYNLLSNIGIGNLIKYNFNFDNGSKNLNKDKSLIVSILPSYNYENNIISPILGYSYQNQANIGKDGINYGWNFYNLQPIDIDDNTYFNLNSYFLNENFTSFTNTFNNHNLNVLFNLDNTLKDNLIFSYNSKNKTNYYYEKDTLSRQNRYEKILNFANSFYITYADFTFGLNSNYTFKNIQKSKDINIPKSIFDINTQLNETQYSIEPSFMYQTYIINFVLKLNYTEKDNVYKSMPQKNTDPVLLESKKNFDEMNNNSNKFYNFYTNLTYNIDDINQISLMFINNKFQYDTPSLLNNDDRDELQQLLSITFSSKINSNFRYSIFTELGNDIFEYLKKQKSSYNYSTKKIKFGFNTIFTSDQITNKSVTEVLANYNIMKYSSSNNDYVIRQYKFEDSLKINFGTLFDIILLTNVKLNEFGGLDWKAFRMYPQRKIDEYFVYPKCSFKIGKGNIFTLGMKSFYSYRFRYINGQYVKEYSYKSFTPTSSIIYIYENILMESMIEYENNYYQNKRKTNINYLLTIRMILN